MFDPLPEEYIAQQFLIYAGYARRKHDGAYEGGCPICREGKSWGSKRRLFYHPETYSIHCKNCHRKWSPNQWIAETSGLSYRDIQNEAKEYEFIPADLINKRNEGVPVIKTPPLPLDAINLMDKQQLTFYKDNEFVRKCINFIAKRRLNKAVNRPDNFYISLSDYTHKNRLCIPFTNDKGEIEFYQTRSFIDIKDDPLPKYLGRKGGNKILFGADRISPDIDYIFIFEGPIDAMFVKNGVAIGGVDLTHIQEDLLNAYPFHEKIWVLDNQHIDETAREVTHRLLDEGETVFIWPKLESIKDFNDICVAKKMNELPATFIVKNSFSGIKGRLQMKKLGL
jgi:hypothetical protein